MCDSVFPLKHPAKRTRVNLAMSRTAKTRLFNLTPFGYLPFSLRKARFSMIQVANDTYGSRRRINLKMCTEGPASLLIDGLISYGQQCEVQAPDSVEGAELKE